MQHCDSARVQSDSNSPLCFFIKQAFAAGFTSYAILTIISSLHTYTECTSLNWCTPCGKAHEVFYLEWPPVLLLPTDDDFH